MSSEDVDGVMSTDQRLIHMANQIARNFAIAGEEKAADMVEDHIRLYWDPAMRAGLIRLAIDNPAELSLIAARAVGRIAAR